MKKFLLTGAATALISAGVQAAPITTIDDFSAGDQLVNDASPNDDNGIRELTISGITLGAGSNFDPYAFVDTAGTGTFGIANGSGDDSTVEIFYDLVTVDAAAIDVNFLNNDNALPMASDLELFVGGASEGSQSLTDSNTPFTITFSLSEAAHLALAGGTSLSFVFNGSPEYDLSVDSIVARVPEPGALGLMGLGLVGLGFAARRKTA